MSPWWIYCNSHSSRALVVFYRQYSSTCPSRHIIFLRVSYCETMRGNDVERGPSFWPRFTLLPHITSQNLEEMATGCSISRCCVNQSVPSVILSPHLSWSPNKHQRKLSSYSKESQMDILNISPRSFGKTN